MIRTAAVVMFALICAGPAAAQTSFPSSMLRDLPAGANLFALLESAQPEITTDRFNSGGLNAGEAEKMSAFLASWSQTQYRIGDVTISSPVDGRPMLFPELAWWERIDVNSARLSASSAATGLTVDLVPRAAAGRWSWSIEGLGSGGGLSQASPSSLAPAIATLGAGAHLAGVASGYVKGDKAGLTIGGVFTRASTFEEHGERTRETRSVFVNSSYALSPESTIRVLALVQANARHGQATYEHGKQWRFFGGFTGATTAPADAPPPAFRQAERLDEGPIPLLIASRLDQRRWVAGARFSGTATARHAVSAGLDIERSSMTAGPIPLIAIAERVDGTPARWWTFTSPNADARRHARTLSAFAADRFALSPSATLQGSLRFESADASAEGAAAGISWRTLLPAVHLEWRLGTPLQLEFLTGVSRHADQPLLGLLAYGDPHAPTANVSRWDGGNTPPGPLVMRVGPGTGGDPGFSAIDPDLQRPITDQFILQLQSRPRPSLTLRVTGLARRQSSLIGVLNIGVPLAGYTLFTIPDANADWVNPADDQQLPVYNRNPGTFGQDRYLLTNPDVEDATMGAVIVSGEVVKPRWLFRIGGTASASVGSGGNRGFTSIENDQSIPGELFTNPNASTYARGRLFNDRAYTIKTMTVLRLPALVTLGAIARFQDGQPFSRLAIVHGLDQGAEAIQTFPNGRSRFSYRATLDLRLQKRFDKSMLRFELIADAYNLLKAASEVEEYVVTGPRFREITAVQPPRAFHLGARITF
jgi:hypothetical protein